MDITKHQQMSLMSHRIRQVRHTVYFPDHLTTLTTQVTEVTGTGTCMTASAVWIRTPMPRTCKHQTHKTNKSTRTCRSSFVKVWLRFCQDFFVPRMMMQEQMNLNMRDHLVDDLDDMYIGDDEDEEYEDQK